MSTNHQPAVLGDTRLTAARLASLAGRVTTTDERPRLPVRTPITDDPVGAVPSCEPADVAAAVDRAREAGTGWADRPVAERAAVLERFGDLVAERRAKLLDVIQVETGKARHHAAEELLDVPATCSYYAQRGPGALADEERGGAVPFATDARVTADPLGVVGVIAPWNYPMTLSMTDAIPALLAGNAVVCKPDERTPFIALALADLLAEAGLPPDAFQVVTGEGPTVGPALIDRVDYVAFTGGTETGRVVGRRTVATSRVGPFDVLTRYPKAWTARTVLALTELQRRLAGWFR